MSRGRRADRMRDPYAALGVGRDADAEAIRRAYRRLARQHHPDLNPDDDAAEERFKDVSRAYAVLSDAARRAAYDEFGEAALDGGFDAEAARRARRAFGGRAGSDGGPLDDLFAGFFGARGTRRGAASPGGRRGSDLEATLELDFLEAARGGEQRLTLNQPGPDGRLAQQTVTVRIPPGVADGGRIRIRGRGAGGSGGAAPGDLYARIRVRPHRFFRREGRDLVLPLPISVREAVLGARVEVPTLDGRVSVTIPAGTDSGTRLRLRGKGVPRPNGGAAGDLYIVIEIRVPKQLDPEAAARLDDLDALDVADLRADLES